MAGATPGRRNQIYQEAIPPGHQFVSSALSEETPDTSDTDFLCIGGRDQRLSVPTPACKDIGRRVALLDESARLIS